VVEMREKGKSTFEILNSKEWLSYKYEVEGLTTRQIAKEVGCSKPTVSNALKKWAIPPRVQKSYKDTKLYDREWLYNKYWEEELCTSEIGAIIGCDRTVVLRALRKLNIPSRSMSESQRGKKSYNYGKHLSKETKKKLSEHNKGEKNYFFDKHFTGELNSFFGKTHTEKTKSLMSAKAKKRCENDDERKRLAEMRRKQRFPRHHTKPELIFDEVIKKRNLGFKYVGDGKLWIGEGRGKGRALNPDFVCNDGRKILVEIMGDYWHSPLLNSNLREDATLTYRNNHYKKYGWKALFIWESDLKREDTEAFVLTLLKREGVIE